MTSWRRNSLHKKGNRVKVIFDGRLQEILHLYYVYLLEELLSRWWSYITAIKSEFSDN